MTTLSNIDAQPTMQETRPAPYSPAPLPYPGGLAVDRLDEAAEADLNRLSRGPSSSPSPPPIISNNNNNNSMIVNTSSSDVDDDDDDDDDSLMPLSNIIASASASSESEADIDVESEGPAIGEVEEDEAEFLNRLFKFMSDKGSPIEKIPVFDHKELDLYQLYRAVVSRGGLEKIIEQKLWRHVTSDLKCDPDRTDAGFRLRVHYIKYLYPYERKFFLGLPDDAQEYNADEPRLKPKSTKAHHPIPSSQQAHHHHQAARTAKPPAAASAHSQQITVNFQQCDISTLKRYKKKYQLKISSNPPRKRDLVRAISQHFAQQAVDEYEVISAFLHTLRASKHDGLHGGIQADEVLE
eukprot:TRINITY_DN279_c0_g1_i1.p1 TRINITY_DN279_c0_g1~~TRINITY_DN279_c0_g1_i1.p1  ORF type:complete len:352 (+),score=121.25 TRINITY_DN279_c0_g1_i1:335-1390(+)